MTPAPAKDLTGQRFGLWTVLERDKTQAYVYWICHCDCGTVKSVRSMSLLNGGSQSCGCLRNGSSNTRSHGMTGTPEFVAWQNMKARCYSLSCIQFKDYGGRGISVCDEWLHDFQAFYDHVGPRPSSQHSLDRIDNNGDYEPGNVRWATRAQQNSNRRIWGIDDKL